MNAQTNIDAAHAEVLANPTTWTAINSQGEDIPLDTLATELMHTGVEQRALKNRSTDLGALLLRGYQRAVGVATNGITLTVAVDSFITLMEHRAEELFKVEHPGTNAKWQKPSSWGVYCSHMRNAAKMEAKPGDKFTYPVVRKIKDPDAKDDRKIWSLSIKEHEFEKLADMQAIWKNSPVHNDKANTVQDVHDDYRAKAIANGQTVLDFGEGPVKVEAATVGEDADDVMNEITVPQRRNLESFAGQLVALRNLGKDEELKNIMDDFRRLIKKAQSSSKAA